MARHFATLDKHRAVAAWYERITDRESFQAALPKGDGIYGQDFYAPWPLE
jgi:glutathione S-transferase